MKKLSDYLIINNLFRFGHKMKLTLAILATQLIKGQDFPWPGVMRLDHIQDGVILAEAQPEVEPQIKPEDTPENKPEESEQ